MDQDSATDANRRGVLREALTLLASLALCAGVAWGGSALTAPGLGPWYDGLRKPAWTPPGKVIGAVWSVLFTLMGLAAWRILRRPWSEAETRRALALHGLHLLLNLGWSACFFSLRMPALALVEIVVLAAAIALTMRAFAAVSKPAAAMLLPYLLWVSFAAVLNASIAWLNA